MLTRIVNWAFGVAFTFAAAYPIVAIADQIRIDMGW